ncbi:hypothetical protein [Halalkalibacillus halophilus]|uniref:hypothetical protein n=1 Tax=Halalkalibacillus halophilus TaxID=392827 RepID=UPI0004039B1F|nr:hypothetical protein [Halalkalibacillus halophilus]
MRHLMMAFSLGILITVGVIGTVYYIEAEVKEEDSSVPTNENSSSTTEESVYDVEGAINFLEAEDYEVLPVEEYNELVSDMESLREEAEAETSSSDQSDDVQEGESTIYTLEIVSGMSSSDIASELENEQIIESADSFNEFLQDNDFSRSIQLGTYVLTSEMSQNQIAITITN